MYGWNFVKRCTQYVIVMIICGVGYVQAAEPQTFIMGTGSKGGTFYPIGQAIDILSKMQLRPAENMSISAAISAGSQENVELLRDNKVQFGILQGLYGYYAWNGTGLFAADGKQENLRSVTMLWKNVEHFLIPTELKKTGTMADMENLFGQKLALGKKNSGTIGSNTTILGNLGLDVSAEYDLVHAGYAGSINSLIDRTVVGMGCPAGIPAKAVSYGFMSMGEKLTMLSFTEEQAKQADGGLGLWAPYTIPAGTYPGQKEEIVTIAQPNFLAVRADIDEHSVYLITKLLYENLNFLQNIHSAANEMSIDKALEGLPIPLHPGAAKYYREIGLAIPGNMISKS